MLASACGGEREDRPAPQRIAPEPAATSTTPPVEPTADPAQPTPDPVVEQRPSEPDDAADEADEAPEELAIPTSPPLPEPPAAPTRAHVFEVSTSDDDEDIEDFGEEPDLSDSDATLADHLFIPEQASWPSEQEEIPIPMGRDSEVEFSIAFPRFEHEDARLARLVNERVREFARSRASARDPGVTCDGIATAQLVSIRCSTYHLSARSIYDAEPGAYSAMTLRISGGEVRPMTLTDAFVPGTDVNALLARGCEKYVEEEELEGDNFDCRAAAHLADHASFGARGIEVNTDTTPTEMMDVGTFTVPYDDVAAQLLARGPLAESLYRRRARVREIDIDPSRRPAPPPTRAAWAVGAMGSTADAAMAWMALPAASRDAIRVVDGYLVAPSEEAARASAGPLPVRQVQVSTTATAIALRAMQLTRESPLRVTARRTAPIARTLPRGALVVAVGDTVDGHVRVLATADADGFIEARALGPADACVPDLAPVLASLPEPARANAAATTRRVFTGQAGGARAIFATELGSSVHIELYRVSEACALESAIARFDRAGPSLTFIGITHTEQRAGQPLIVTTTGGDSPDIAVHTYDGSRQVFSTPLAEAQRVAVGRSEDGTFYPVVVLDEAGERADAFVWTGDTLAHPPAPAPAPQ